MKSPTNEDLLKLSHKFQVSFALFCANQVKHFWKDIPEAVKAIEITERWLVGEATKEECASAAYAADAANAAYAAAAASAAAYAAYSAASAANAAAYAAAYASANADKQSFIKAQWDYYNELLHFDSNFEKIAL